MTMTRGKKTQQTLSSSTILLLVLVGASCLVLVSGRYLPTRSDNSRRERIKDVLRLVSDEQATSTPLPRVCNCSHFLRYLRHR